MTGIAIYLVWRDAKCLADAACAGS